MSLEEANKLVAISMNYTPNGWYWVIHSGTPYGDIIGYNKYENPNAAELELEGFLRYFTNNVLKSGDTIRAYVNKHNPNSKEK